MNESKELHCKFNDKTDRCVLNPDPSAVQDDPVCYITDKNRCAVVKKKKMIKIKPKKLVDVELVEPIEPIEPIELIEPIKPIKPIEQMRKIESKKIVQIFYFLISYTKKYFKMTKIT